MELMERNSTDKRLDDLNGKVDQGFERVETDIRADRAETRAEFAALRAETKAGFDSMNKRFDSMNERFDSMNERFEAMNGSINERFERTHRLLIQFCGGLLGSFVVAAAALVATQI